MQRRPAPSPSISLTSGILILNTQAQAVYTATGRKLPTLKELSAEYDALREHKKKDELALEELKPQLATLNHIKYNCDILMRDVLPEEKYHTRSEREDR